MFLTANEARGNAVVWEMSCSLSSLAVLKGGLEQKFLLIHSKNTHLTILTLPTCNVLKFFSILVYFVVRQGLEKEKAGCNPIMQLISWPPSWDRKQIEQNSSSQPALILTAHGHSHKHSQARKSYKQEEENQVCLLCRGIKEDRLLKRHSSLKFGHRGPPREYFQSAVEVKIRQRNRREQWMTALHLQGCFEDLNMSAEERESVKRKWWNVSESDMYGCRWTKWSSHGDGRC